MPQTTLSAPLAPQLILLSLLATGFTGTLAYGHKVYNALPAPLLLETSLFLSSLLLMARMNRTAFLYSLAAMAYIFGGFLWMKNGQHRNVLDFLLIYKAFFYCILLAPFVGRDLISHTNLRRFFRALAILFLVKYSASHLLGLTSRPGLYMENNFELMLVLFVFVAVFDRQHRIATIDLMLLLSIFVLAGSLSGIAMLAAVLAICFLEKRHITATRLALAIVASAGIALVILSRLSSAAEFSQIDRIVMLGLFIRETGDWGLLRWLLGVEPITPLSPQTCADLSYYQSMMSFEDPGICFSVVLHGFVSRTLYDHGIIGLGFLLGFVVHMIRISGFGLRAAFSIAAALALNGISVSSMNSIMAAIGLAIVLATSSTRTRADEIDAVKLRRRL